VPAADVAALRECLREQLAGPFEVAAFEHHLREVVRGVCDAGDVADLSPERVRVLEVRAGCFGVTVPAGELAENVRGCREHGRVADLLTVRTTLAKPCGADVVIGGADRRDRRHDESVREKHAVARLAREFDARRREAPCRRKIAFEDCQRGRGPETARSRRCGRVALRYGERALHALPALPQPARAPEPEGGGGQVECGRRVGRHEHVERGMEVVQLPLHSIELLPREAEQANPPGDAGDDACHQPVGGGFLAASGQPLSQVAANGDELRVARLGSRPAPALDEATVDQAGERGDRLEVERRQIAAIAMARGLDGREVEAARERGKAA
jgi:hypothetical protein